MDRSPERVEAWAAITVCRVNVAMSNVIERHTAAVTIFTFAKAVALEKGSRTDPAAGTYAWMATVPGFSVRYWCRDALLCVDVWPRWTGRQVQDLGYGRNKLFFAQKHHDSLTVITFRRGAWEEHFLDLAAGLEKR
jgi:hypothetical protein